MSLSKQKLSLLDSIQKLREDTAKYMGWEREGKYYTRNQMAIRLVSEWKPDLNSEQADMIEDKAFQEDLIDFVVISKDVEGFSAYCEKDACCVSEGHDKIKKLARALALYGAVKKAIDN